MTEQDLTQLTDEQLFEGLTESAGRDQERYRELRAEHVKRLDREAQDRRGFAMPGPNEGEGDDRPLPVIVRGGKRF